MAAVIKQITPNGSQMPSAAMRDCIAPPSNRSSKAPVFDRAKYASTSPSMIAIPATILTAAKRLGGAVLEGPTGSTGGVLPREASPFAAKTRSIDLSTGLCPAALSR
jgi:hypothetical protein